MDIIERIKGNIIEIINIEIEVLLIKIDLIILLLE